MRDGKWAYTIRAYRGSKLVMETVHKTKASCDIEISAYRDRIKRNNFGYIEVISHVEFEPDGREKVLIL